MEKEGEEMSHDITKCQDEECPMKSTCYRYMVKADNLFQSYFSESPREDDKCDYYWGKSGK